MTWNNRVMIAYQPKGSMCMACAHQFDNCAGLPFHEMPILGKPGQELIIIKCTHFQNIAAADKRHPDNVTSHTNTDPFLQHEALDRCHVITSMLEEHLLTHPYVEQHADIKYLLSVAGDALAQAYQKIGLPDGT